MWRHALCALLALSGAAGALGCTPTVEVSVQLQTDDEPGAEIDLNVR